MAFQPIGRKIFCLARVLEDLKQYFLSSLFKDDGTVLGSVYLAFGSAHKNTNVVMILSQLFNASASFNA